MRREVVPTQDDWMFLAIGVLELFDNEKRMIGYLMIRSPFVQSTGMRLAEDCAKDQTCVLRPARATEAIPATVSSSRSCSESVSFAVRDSGLSFWSFRFL